MLKLVMNCVCRYFRASNKHFPFTRADHKLRVAAVLLFPLVCCDALISCSRKVTDLCRYTIMHLLITSIYSLPVPTTSQVHASCSCCLSVSLALVLAAM